MKLCRHKRKDVFDLLGFGLILHDYGISVKVRWIICKTKWKQHIIRKEALIILE